MLRFDNIESRLESPAEPVVVNDTLPKDAHHGQKFIAFGPDGMLYVPVGAPCNICDKRRTIRLRHHHPDEARRLRPRVFASGVRNTSGFDWHPRTRELWFTDNGRDNLGDDVPRDELNRAPRKGLHFGYPFCHQGDVGDPEFGKTRPCAEFLAPARKLDPHVAAIGMRFYTGRMFPEEYRNQIIIAEHGSWNRSTPQGYRLSLVKLDGNKVVSYTRFAEGWLRGMKPAPAGGAKIGDVWGRPADVLVMPDGALLVSDDRAGVIYRISSAADADRTAGDRRGQGRGDRDELIIPPAYSPRRSPARSSGSSASCAGRSASGTCCRLRRTRVQVWKRPAHRVDQHVGRLEVRGGLGMSRLPALESGERVFLPPRAPDLDQRELGRPAARRLHARGSPSCFL